VLYKIYTISWEQCHDKNNKSITDPLINLKDSIKWGAASFHDFTYLKVNGKWVKVLDFNFGVYVRDNKAYGDLSIISQWVGGRVELIYDRKNNKGYELNLWDIDAKSALKIREEYGY